jgi:hypothetical protein
MMFKKNIAEVSKLKDGNMFSSIEKQQSRYKLSELRTTGPRNFQKIIKPSTIASTSFTPILTLHY